MGEGKKRRRTSEQGDNRRTDGRFEKGKSGNPGGRPKDNERVKLLCQALTEEAIGTLALWMREGEGKVAVSAATAILDRGWGKPTQAISGPDGGPIDINLNEVRGAVESKLARIAAMAAEAGVSKQP